MSQQTRTESVNGNVSVAPDASLSKSTPQLTQANPIDRLLLTSSAFVLARCLHVVAELGVADVLNETPQTTTSLATATGTHAGALNRVLRLLSTQGIFELRGSEVHHTPASRLLRADHPQSMRSIVRWLGSPIMRASFDAIDHSMRTGLPAADQVATGGIWNYLAEHPAEGRLFEEAMQGKSHGQIARVLSIYDFSPFGVIGDIGGGYGHFLQAVLGVTRRSAGVLFELPNVVGQVSSIASERLRLQAGDFFVDALPVCDAYVLIQVIHDWGDKEAATILAAVRRAAPAHAKLLLIETLVPDDPNLNWAKVLDVYMLTAHGGLERGERQYADLLGASGFQLERTIELGANEAILQAIPQPGWAAQ